MQRLIALYLPGNKLSNFKGSIATEIVLKRDTNKGSSLYNKIFLESLDKRFKIVDFNEETNVAKAIPFNDIIK